MSSILSVDILTGFLFYNPKVTSQLGSLTWHFFSNRDMASSMFTMAKTYPTESEIYEGTQSINLGWGDQIEDSAIKWSFKVKIVILYVDLM